MMVERETEPERYCHGEMAQGLMRETRENVKRKSREATLDTENGTHKGAEEVYLGTY